ncbi:Transcriptional regulator, contains XRE-family HTH domain [Pseudobutyrivibrio sp. YE44]|uniref:helix-turn-helix domain-containing protein n=1 Tax=Pseudobutyrivibrio sp. YE44 TaxID=1520802 RepID=UPI00089166A9|nr:helix-turn-helix transcriptional regulator [Pseudobutyrivibrio sp. YE44]SDB47895.1 Transcriptional regulator, contains XRE-family HTH domain [Pseudobutyrivibrio sp. YE44]
MTITERIFCLLKQKGMTQKDFSIATGIAPSTISDWKRKGFTPSADKIMDICAALNVSPEQLLTGTGIDSVEDSVEYQLDYQGKQLIAEYGELNSDAKKRLMAYAKKLRELSQMEEL